MSESAITNDGKEKHSMLYFRWRARGIANELRSPDHISLLQLIRGAFILLFLFATFSYI